MESILQTQVLVGRIHDGNKEALNQLCERYMPRILYAVRARLGMRLRRKVQSMDVLQDAMVDIVKGIDNFEFRSDGAFLHYVNRIIENNIRDEAAKFQAAKRDIAKEQEAVVSDKEGFKQLDVEDYREQRLLASKCHKLKICRDSKKRWIYSMKSHRNTTN